MAFSLCTVAVGLATTQMALNERAAYDLTKRRKLLDKLFSPKEKRPFRIHDLHI